MAISVLTPKTVSELVKIVAKKGKSAVLVSGVDPADRPVPGKVTVDLNHIAALNEISTQKDRVTIGTGVNLGRLSREAAGENGLIRQAASLIGSPLVRNRITVAGSTGSRSRRTSTSRRRWCCSMRRCVCRVRPAKRTFRFATFLNR